MIDAKVLTNLESLGDLVGHLRGISDGLDEDQYMEGLIRQAHGRAKSAFNIAAAATGAAGHMNHVFEFNTSGVTAGTPKLQATSPAAQLWVHTLTGHGGSMDIGYSFRPATQPNPTPTFETTGVDNKYLQKLSRRKYIFWNKAFVMETGQTITIAPKRGNFLFVPFGGNPPSNPAYTRGFVLTRKPVDVQPGRSTKGQFTAFWMSWWAAQGDAIIYRSMEKSVTMDIEKAVAAATKEAQAKEAKMEPPATTNIVGAAAKARGSAKKLWSRLFHRGDE